MRVEKILVLGWFVASLFLAGLFSALGLWQIHRAQWKERLLESYRRAAYMQPKDLSGIVSWTENIPSRADVSDQQKLPQQVLPMRISAIGRYVKHSTLLLDNQIHQGKLGAMVYSLFIPKESRRAVLVNRGWIALTARRTWETNIDLDVSTDEQKITGLLVPPPSVGIRLGEIKTTFDQPPRLQTLIDLDSLRKTITTPIFTGVVMLDAENKGGFLRDWRVLPNTLTPEKHIGYAIQWFGLALTTLLTYVILYLRQKRNERTPTN
jgi:surfeit locus 1 family protein